MRGVRRTGEQVVAVVMAVAALTACSGQNQQAALPTASSPSESLVTTASPTSQPPRPSATDTATTASSTASEAVPSAGPTRWPRALGEPTQGDPVWAVYLAVTHSSSDAAIDQALQAAAGVGYAAVTGDVACDQGALAALGLAENDFWSAASLYFATRQDADDFVASYQAQGGQVVGSAKINLGCLD